MSSNRRLGPSIAHLYNYAWLPSTRHSASSWSGHGSPMSTAVLPACQSRCWQLAASVPPVSGCPQLQWPAAIGQGWSFHPPGAGRLVVYTDGHQVGRSPRKDVQNGDRGEEEAPSPP